MKPEVKLELCSLLISLISITALHAQETHFKHFDVKNSSVIHGKVTKFTTNDNYVIEGFTLTSSLETYHVKFPPHMGKKIISYIRKGSIVTVSGFNDNSQGEQIFKMNSISLDKRMIKDNLPAMPEMKATQTFVKVSGKIKDYRKDHAGKINGFVLNNKIVVKFAPDLGSQVTNVVSPGSQIFIEGLQRILSDGEVQLEKLDVVGASVISTNGQEYLVR